MTKNQRTACQPELVSGSNESLKGDAEIGEATNVSKFSDRI